MQRPSFRYSHRPPPSPVPDLWHPQLLASRACSIPLAFSAPSSQHVCFQRPQLPASPFPGSQFPVPRFSSPRFQRPSSSASPISNTQSPQRTISSVPIFGFPSLQRPSFSVPSLLPYIPSSPVTSSHSPRSPFSAIRGYGVSSFSIPGFQHPQSPVPSFHRPQFPASQVQCRYFPSPSFQSPQQCQRFPAFRIPVPSVASLQRSQFPASSSTSSLFPAYPVFSVPNPRRLHSPPIPDPMISVVGMSGFSFLSSSDTESPVPGLHHPSFQRYQLPTPLVFFIYYFIDHFFPASFFSYTHLPLSPFSEISAHLFRISRFTRFQHPQVPAIPVCSVPALQRSPLPAPLMSASPVSGIPNLEHLQSLAPRGHCPQPPASQFSGTPASFVPISSDPCHQIPACSILSFKLPLPAFGGFLVSVSLTFVPRILNSPCPCLAPTLFSLPCPQPRQTAAFLPFTAVFGPSSPVVSFLGPQGFQAISLLVPTTLSSYLHYYAHCPNVPKRPTISCLPPPLPVG